MALIALAAGMVGWEAWRRVPIELAGNPLAAATFARLTDWEGTVWVLNSDPFPLDFTVDVDIESSQ